VDGPTAHHGAAAVSALLAGVPPPTAVIGFNDLTAIGLLRGLRAAGRRVPEDIAVVGFDDIELAAWTDPALTTVRQPTEELGRWAVTRIADALADPERPMGPSRVVLEPTLVVRATTAPPQGTV